MKSKIIAPIFILFFLGSLGGCASGPANYYVRNSSFEDNHHVKAAMIPFANLTTEREADKKIMYSFITHLLKTHYFDVIEMGETQKAMKEAKVRGEEDLSVENIKKIGELSGADVLLLGVVEEYKIDSSTMLGEKIFVPEAAFSVRLVSTADGSILWSANHHRRGDDKVMIFGMGRIDSISQLTDKVVADTVHSLVKVMRTKEDALSLFKNGHAKHPDPQPLASGPADKAMQAQMEQLKKEKESLKKELAVLKEKMDAPAKAPGPAAENHVLKEESPADGSEQSLAKGSDPVPVKDERQVIKEAFQTESKRIKSQYQ